MFEFKIHDIDVKLTRKKIKNIYLRLKPHSDHVIVTAPLKMPLKFVQLFIHDKLSWINQKQKKLNSLPQTIQLERLTSVHRQNMLEKSEVLIQYWQKQMNVSVKQFSIRKMKTRWGSCTPRNQTIRLNLELIRKPPECLEYVIVHELAHLIEASHNKHFKAIMDKHLPNWRSIRKMLNTNSN